MAPWVKALQGKHEKLSLQPRSLRVVQLEYLECQRSYRKCRWESEAQEAPEAHGPANLADRAGHEAEGEGQHLRLPSDHCVHICIHSGKPSGGRGTITSALEK